MIKLLLLISIALLTEFSFAAIIKSAKLDDSKKNIIIEVEYSGGCKKHDFSIQLTPCSRSHPAQCSAELIDKTQDDHCEAYITTTIIIALAQYKLSDPAFKNATLTINGDINKSTNKVSNVSVKLP